MSEEAKGEERPEDEDEEEETKIGEEPEETELEEAKEVDDDSDDEDDFTPANAYYSSDSDDADDDAVPALEGGDENQPMDNQRFVQITGALLDLFPLPPSREQKENAEQIELLVQYCQQRESPDGDLIDKLDQLARSQPSPDDFAILVEDALVGLAEASPQDPSKAKHLMKGLRKMRKKCKEGGDKEPRESLHASYPDLRLSEYVFTFGMLGTLCPLQTTHEHLVVFMNTGSKKASFQISLLQPAQEGCTVTFEPASGVVKKAQSLDVVISITFTKRSVQTKLLVMIEVTGGHRILAYLDARAQPAVFAVPPAELPAIVPAEIPRHQCMRDPLDAATMAKPISPVPEFLIAVQNLFFDAGGLEQDGIFRHAADEIAVQKLKLAFNCGEYSGQHGRRASDVSDASSVGRRSTVGGADFDVDIHSVAQLIKVWFRELPSSVLTTIPVETMMGCENEVAVLAAFKQIPEPQASLLVYLLDLLANVAMCADTNRMNAKNLAIVYGPNLLVSSDDAMQSPMQTLVMSQKSVYFMQLLIEWHMREAYGASAEAASSAKKKPVFTA